MVSFQNLKFGAPAIKRMYEEINDNKIPICKKKLLKILKNLNQLNMKI